MPTAKPNCLPILGCVLGTDVYGNVYYCVRVVKAKSTKVIV